MFKKTIGLGILACVLFLAALVFIPSTINPSAEIIVDANHFTIQQTLSDINKFREWDPKAISDTTVSYSFSMVDGKPSLEVVDSLNRVMASYVIEKSGMDEIQISVNIQKVEPLLYSFKISSEGNKTKVIWSMDFDGNLMMSLFGAEDQLSGTFNKGLVSFKNYME